MGWKKVKTRLIPNRRPCPSPKAGAQAKSRPWRDSSRLSCNSVGNEVGVCSPGKENRMLPFTGKNMIVIGGSRGVGWRIVETGLRNGARVLAVARREVPMRHLCQEDPGTEV